MKTRHCFRGFTLIELLTALAASAVLLVAVYGVFSRALRLRDDATARIREVRIEARATAILRNDLRNARVSGGMLAATLEGSQSGQSGSFPGYLKFTTTTTPDVVRDALEAPAPDLQQVEYYLVTDPDADDRRAGLLVRTAERDLLATVEATPTEEPLLRGIESMEVAFYDGAVWQESWSYEESSTVPEAVRVRLQRATPAGGAVLPPIEVLVPWTVKPAIAAAQEAQP